MRVGLEFFAVWTGAICRMSWHDISSLVKNRINFHRRGLQNKVRTDVEGLDAVEPTR